MPLWIIITVAAALFQNIRTTMQQKIRHVLSVDGANFIRYLYGAPLALGMLAFLIWGTGRQMPALPLSFLVKVTIAGLAQIIATSLMIHAFSLRNYAVGTVYSKTETLFVALFATFIASEPLTLGSWVGILICLCGVAILSVRGSFTNIRNVLADLTHKGALYGILSGIFFAIAAGTIREASKDLTSGDFMIRGITTLASMNTIQIVLMLAYLAKRDPSQFRKIGVNWRSSIWVGIFSVLGSAGWALAMTLENAALVRAVGQIELVFTFIASHVVLKERPSTGEWIGSLLVVGGVVLILVERCTDALPRPLTGLRILDFSTTIAGPHYARLLADMGAEVIKVEAAEGDLMRSRPVMRDGASTMFGQLNAGKRSIVLDLKKQEAIAVVRKLVATVDVVLENYRPGVMKQLGIDYPELAKVNPKLIYCAISGYGQTGPGAGRPAYAPVIHASTGYDMAHAAQQEGRERPDNCAIFVADYASGAYAMGAILAAIHQRHFTGKGQMIDVSMFETLIGMLPTEINRSQFDFEMPSRPMYGPIEASDGYVMLATASERTFQDMATTAGRRDWLTDPRFEKYADRRMNWGLLIDELEQWSKKHTVKEVVAALEKRGVPCSPYLTLTEALQDPQVAHRGSMVAIEDSAGTYKSPAPPFRFSGSPMQSGPHVPALGEDTRAILKQAGLGDSEIEALAKAGVAR